MQKYILCLAVFFWYANALAQNGNLPNNPWNTSKQTIDNTNNITPEITQAENHTTDLPQNPWNSANNDNRKLIREKVNYHNYRDQTATVNTSVNQALQQRDVRQVGDVGKIGYTYTSKAVITKNNDDDFSLFDGLEDYSPSVQTIPEALTNGSLNSGTDSDFSYEKLKQKGLSQWHRLTSPITNTAQKWFNAVKQTGEDLLK